MIINNSEDKESYNSAFVSLAKTFIKENTITDTSVLDILQEQNLKTINQLITDYDLIMNRAKEMTDGFSVQ